MLYSLTGLGSPEVAGDNQTAVEQRSLQLQLVRRWQTTGSLTSPTTDQSAIAVNVHVLDLAFDTTVELEVVEDAYFRTEVTDNQACSAVDPGFGLLLHELTAFDYKCPGDRDVSLHSQQSRQPARVICASEQTADPSRLHLAVAVRGRCPHGSPRQRRPSLHNGNVLCSCPHLCSQGASVNAKNSPIATSALTHSGDCARDDAHRLVSDYPAFAQTIHPRQTHLTMYVLGAMMCANISVCCHHSTALTMTGALASSSYREWSANSHTWPTQTWRVWLTISNW